MLAQALEHSSGQVAFSPCMVVDAPTKIVVRKLPYSNRKRLCFFIVAPPKFKKAPERWWLEDYFPFLMAFFRGEPMLVYKGFHVNFVGSPNNPSITMGRKSPQMSFHLHIENYKHVLIPKEMGPISLWLENWGIGFKVSYQEVSLKKTYKDK